MRYMLLLYGCEDRPQPGDEDYAAALERVNAFADECRRRGALLAGDPLQHHDTATTVHVRNGQTMITDGPFPETHEHLGGYYLLECPSLDEALELAALCPIAASGWVEVRPVADLPGVDLPGVDLPGVDNVGR